jgi:hypothetical protein
MPHAKRPLGVTLLVFFCIFGMLMASLSAFMLLFPGSFFDSLWRLNPRAHEGFAVLGLWAVLLMVIVASACATTAFGLWRCARWGYITAIVGLSVNLLSDTLNAFIGHDWRTLIGLPVGGAVIIYLVSRRQVFA